MRALAFVFVMTLWAPHATAFFLLDGGGGGGGGGGGSSEATKAPVDEFEDLLRPKPIVVIETAAPLEIFGRMKGLIEDAGFNVENWDPREPFLQANRLAADSKKEGFDRIVSWLERDFRDPDKFIKIYLVYAKYEKISKRKSTFYRVEIDKIIEEQEIGELRQAIIGLS